MKKKFSINKFFLKISILFILILLTFFVSPLFLNLNNYKSNFEMELSSLLKTSVKIEGNIEYSFKKSKNSFGFKQYSQRGKSKSF